MTGRAGRLLLVIAVVLAARLVGIPPFGGPERTGSAISAVDGITVPASCAEANPGWSEVGVDLASNDPPIAPGRVFHVSDGTIAVLVVVTAANEEGRATSFDFSASVHVAAVIVRAADGGALVPFVPPARNGAGLGAPDQAGIDAVAFCYRVQVPNPPEPGATEGPEITPTAELSPTDIAQTPVPDKTATATAGTFDIGAVQTANALATEAADAQGTAAAVSTAAAAGEATRQAEAAAAEATIVAHSTARADQDATAAARATEAAAAATTAAEEHAAVQATASAEVAAAQATSAALATADAANRSELATAQAVQTEAAATIAALQSATDVPSPSPESSPSPEPSPSPSPTPAETRYYGVPDDEGFDAWAASLPPGWTVTDGLLVADGSVFQGYVQPPRTVDRDNYAIEAEIRIVEEPACAANFGLLVRGSESGFYAGGVEWVCGAGSSIRAWALNNVLTQEGRSIDQEWHTYRIAVNGDQITVSVDGVQVLQATDASFPTGGQIALWSNGVMLEVRSFKVLVAS